MRCVILIPAHPSEDFLNHLLLRNYFSLWIISPSCAGGQCQSNKELSTFSTISLHLYEGGVCVWERGRGRESLSKRETFTVLTHKSCNQKLEILILKISTDTNFKFPFPPAGPSPPPFPLLHILLPKFPIYFYAQNTSSLFIILSPASFVLRVSRQFSSNREFWGQVLT